MENKIIDVEPVKEPQQSQALQVRETGGAVDRAMSVNELRENLAYIKEVMQTVMKEGQDYGKVPGCGDKPGLFQPGAQKLCMTFRLTDSVKEERVTELPNFHREYSFVVMLTSATGRTWEGVGTCSTLESKYRYRKGERKCPKCGQSTIIKGKAEYGGGFICFTKKGGCGAKFNDNDPAITSQPAGQVENENPADHWNTARKMAFKRALVHASINATNTSELWSQDLEDLRANGVVGEREETHQNAPGSTGAATPPRTGATPPQASQPPKAKEAAPKEQPLPTPEGKAKMINNLCGPGGANRQLVTEYFVQAGILLPNEALEDIPLMWIPATQGQMRALTTKIGDYVQNGTAEKAFPPNSEPKATKAKAVEVPRDPPGEPPTEEEKDLWFMKVIAPIPRKGMKRDEYMKNPDTIGSLWALRHGNNDEAAVARQRLFGFVSNFEPKGWTKRDGTEMPPSEADIKFREACDAFLDWFETQHPDEKL